VLLAIIWRQKSSGPKLSTRAASLSKPSIRDEEFARRGPDGRPGWSAPPVLRPARPLACVAKKERQPASDDFDISQDPSPKLNLGLELANITRCRGRHHAAANRILKAKKRGINKIHLGALRKNWTR
jgi:hypothetical protein